MTLHTGNGHPLPINLQQSSQHPQSPPGRRRNTVGSPTSAEFKPSASAHFTLPRAPQQLNLPQFFPILSPTQGPLLQAGGYFVESDPRRRSTSPSAKSVSPSRRRQNSKPPERGHESSQGTSAAALSNGRKPSRQQSLNSKSASSNMPGRKDDIRNHPIAAPRPSFKTHRSNISTQSNSLPSTPNHHPRNISGASRSPSPTSCMLDSPRSAASEPVTTMLPKPRSSGCIYETALIGAKRRMPYSLGIDKLGREKPRLDKLQSAEEGKLTRDIEELYEKLRPSEAEDERKRKFLDKLGRMLNEEWPGHDIKVHAFGSTENHLCMKGSDVDVCITTTWSGLGRTCDIAHALGKRGMERVVCVPGAKVPIVKIWDPEYKVACDMNVNGALALDNTRMIKTYVEIDPRVRPLAMILKYWTKQRCLNDAAGGGTLSSYTWICMILNFLQTRDPPVLPALHMRPHKKKPPIQGVDTSFDDDIDALRGFGKKNAETIGELLFGFFKTYGHELDYEKHVLSVRTGALLSKEEKNWKWLQNNRLCVEEPFNIDRNLGNTADDCSMRGIHLEFRRAHKVLSEKADLAECCERYEFPPEEIHHFVPPQPPSRPVTLSRSNSNHGRLRNNFGNNRGRGYGWNNRQNQNRRASSSASYNNFVQQQPQFYPPELFGYVATPHEQLLALQAQIQAHAQAQAHFAQAQAAQAQTHAQLQGHQVQAQNTSQNNPSSAPATATTPSQDPLVPFYHLASWPYIASLYGIQMTYPGIPLGHETAPGATSSTSNPLLPDIRHDTRNDRLGVGRGSTQRTGGNNPNQRSHSQPPPLYPAQAHGNNWMQNSGMPVSEDEDYGDHSSSGNLPETPPAEETDEYVGYYSIGDPLSADLAVVDGDAEEEPFIEQKSMVDRQKRFSHEKLPPPMLGPSRETSPLPAPRKKHHRETLLQLSLDDRSPHGSYLEDQGPVIVNGAVPLATASSYNSIGCPKHSPPSDGGIFPYESPVVNGLPSTNFDGSSDSSLGITNGVNNSSRQQELYAQRLLELHNQAAQPELALTCLDLPASSHYSGKSMVDGVPMNGGSVPQNTAVQIASLNLGDDELDDSLSPQLSPNLRQRAATQQLLWTNTRITPLDLKNKGYSSSQEDLALPLTPVPEARTPSPTSMRRGGGTGQSVYPPKPASNGVKTPFKNEKGDPVPPMPTPAEKEKHNHDKSTHKHGNKNKANGKGPNAHHTKTGGQHDTKSEQKVTGGGGGSSGPNKSWKQQKSKAAKKRAAVAKAESTAVSSGGSLNGSERKGG